MLHCWDEDPLRRPTFTELRDHLEEIMSQGSRYMSFDIDEKNAYYNVASFNSIPSETEDDIDLEEEILQKPPQFLTIEELKKERQLNDESIIIDKDSDWNATIKGFDEKDDKGYASLEEKSTANRYTKPSELLQNASLGIL